MRVAGSKNIILDFPIIIVICSPVVTHMIGHTLALQFKSSEILGGHAMPCRAKKIVRINYGDK